MLESARNHSPAPAIMDQSMETLSSTKLVPGAKRLGTAALELSVGTWLRILVSRTARECISVVLSYPICAYLL